MNRHPAQTQNRVPSYKSASSLSIHLARLSLPSVFESLLDSKAPEVVNLKLCETAWIEKNKPSIQSLLQSATALEEIFPLGAYTAHRMASSSHSFIAFLVLSITESLSRSKRFGIVSTLSQTSMRIIRSKIAKLFSASLDTKASHGYKKSLIHIKWMQLLQEYTAVNVKKVYRFMLQIRIIF